MLNVFPIVFLTAKLQLHNIHFNPCLAVEMGIIKHGKFFKTFVMLNGSNFR